jgi:hypothetical protein
VNTLEITPGRRGAHTRAGRRRSTRSRTPAPFQVGESLVVRLHEDFGAAGRSLAVLDPTSRLRRSLVALGVADHVALGETVERTPDGFRFALVWRFEPRSVSQVRLEWDGRVTPEGEGDALLTVTTRISASDDAARGRMLDAWSVVEGLAAAVARQIAKAVQADAEADLEDRLAA